MEPVTLSLLFFVLIRILTTYYIPVATNMIGMEIPSISSRNSRISGHILPD